MKYLIPVLAFALPVWAQSIDVKDVSAEDEGSTTIEITKGKKATKDKPEANFEVIEGSASVEGDASATEKEAKAAHKAACKTWQKEFRAESKENGNIVISTNCGKAECSGSAGNKVCSSSATYKVKTPTH